MIQTMLAFLRTCPVLQKIQANQLGDSAGDISLQAIGGNPMIYRYTDGSSLRQFLFLISSREDAFGTMAAEEFYEALTYWLEHHMPTLGDGKTAQRIEVTKTASIAERDYTGLRYELTCRLVYYQKGE